MSWPNAFGLHTKNYNKSFLPLSLLSIYHTHPPPHPPPWEERGQGQIQSSDKVETEKFSSPSGFRIQVTGGGKGLMIYIMSETLP